MNGRTNSNGTTTDTIQIPLDPVTNLDAVAGNAQVTLTWTDPLNKYATPEGEQAGDPDQLVSVWSYTAIVRKEGSAPTGIHDGILVAESQVHNQYQTNGYVDSGLTNDTLYYYGLFAVNEDGIESDVTAISAMPKAGTPVRDLPVGTLININENGAPIEYMIVHQGNPNTSIYDDSCNGTWLLRKNIEEYRYMCESDIRWEYNWSNLHRFFVNDEFTIYGDWRTRYTQQSLSLINQIKIPHITYSGSSTYSTNYGSSGLDCQFFCLSPDEVGFSGTYIIGSKLDYFETGESDSANLKRMTGYDPSNISDGGDDWWLRPSTTWANSEYGLGIDWYGRPKSYAGHQDLGNRPACILSRDARVDQYFNLVTE